MDAFDQSSMDKLLYDLEQSPLSRHIIVPGSDVYQTRLDSYFSQQEQSLHPSAIVAPQSAQEVAEIVKLITKQHEVPYFAVRSGGKMPQAGSANIEGGLTIDLSGLNSIVPAPDGDTVQVGCGALWGDVYTILDAKGLSISGGRDATVGVGGLSLGGGISLFGPLSGFVCDSIKSFEVVLADGSIVQAAQSSHPDLWRALKGGSNNFGIVTNLEFQSFAHGAIWGGQNVSPVETAAQHLDALCSFTADPTPDLHATVITSFAVYQGTVIVNEGLKYTKPVENPPVFNKFLAIQPCMYSSNKITSIAAAATEQAAFNTNGRRQALTTTTFVNDREMLQYAFDAWQASVPSVQTITNVQWSITFQPLTQAMTLKGSESGGNVLGLEGAPPLIVAQIALSWDDTEHDNLVDKALGILADIAATAKSRRLFHPFVYLNYAWSSQDPIAGYGTVNRSFMQEVSRKYDPNGLFQSGLIGGFKLFPQAK